MDLGTTLALGWESIQWRASPSLGHRVGAGRQGDNIVYCGGGACWSIRHFLALLIVAQVNSFIGDAFLMSFAMRYVGGWVQLQFAKMQPTQHLMDEAV